MWVGVPCSHFKQWSSLIRKILILSQFADWGISRAKFLACDAVPATCISLVNQRKPKSKLFPLIGILSCQRMEAWAQDLPKCYRWTWWTCSKQIQNTHQLCVTLCVRLYRRLRWLRCCNTPVHQNSKMRHLLVTRRQKPSETLTKFLQELRKLSNHKHVRYWSVIPSSTEWHHHWFGNVFWRTLKTSKLPLIKQTP